MAYILVIEDNPANVELIVYLLEAFGHRTTAISDGAEGIELARTRPPDLIVCDVQLPTIDGYEVARRVKGDPSLSAIPLIAVTSFAMVGDRERILAAGFDGYLSKPIDPETIVAQLETFLASTTCGLSLQIASAPALPTVALAPVASRATILVVDDSAVNRELMHSFLEPLGYKVVTADSVDHALVLAYAQAPQLVISDLHMPGQDGFDLIRRFKADPVLRAIKIIIHSATISSEHDCARALELGAARCITRPIEPQLMVDEIEMYLREEN